MRPSMALPVFLTPAETADLLRTTRKAINAMSERGPLPWRDSDSGTRPKGGQRKPACPQGFAGQRPSPLLREVWL